jgi:predicted DNA-binding transcriptional regulator AlpA
MPKLDPAINSKSQFFLGSLPAEGFVRQAQLLTPGPISWSSATLWRKVRSGDFPAPIKLSERITAWRVEDIRDWINNQGHKTASERKS